MEFSLLAAAAVAAASASTVLWWEGRERGGRDTRERGDLLLTAAVAGLAVGRVAAMTGGGTNPLTHPADLLIVRGGVDTGFAAASGILTAMLLARRSLPGRLDEIAPAAVAALAGWHAACLLRGGCLGTPTGLPWGITQPGGAVARHPVEIYAALLLAAGALGLILWRRRGAPPGAATGAAIAWAGTVRMVTEPMRVGLGGGPAWWYAAGIACGAAVVTWALLAARRAAAQP